MASDPPNQPEETPAKTRELGFVEGTVPDTFFEPLPEEVLDAWEGEASRAAE